MAYSQPFVRVSFGGTLAGGMDIWSCSFHLGSADDERSAELVLADVLTVSDEITDAIKTLVSATETNVPSDVKLTDTKFAGFNTTGAQVGESVTVVSLAQGATGGPYIPQASVVVGLVNTDRAKDPGRYNRFYLPTSQYAFGQFRMSTTEQSAYLGAAQDFVQSLIDIGATVSPSVIVPIVASSKAVAGSSSAVDAVRVGKTIDTQRRRRNSIPEEYTMLPVSYA